MAARELGNALGNPLGLSKSSLLQPYSVAVFANSSGVFEIPPGVARVRLSVVGGGGAGDWALAGDVAGNGGGGGGFSQSEMIPVCPGAVVSYVAGKGANATAMIASSASLYGRTIQATSGSSTTPGVGSGGLVNTSGGTGGLDVASGGGGGGGGAGGPDGNGGNGAVGVLTTTATLGATGSPGAGGGGSGGMVITTTKYGGNGGGGVGREGFGGIVKTNMFIPLRGLVLSTPGEQGTAPVMGHGGHGGLGGGGGGGGGYTSTYGSSGGPGGHGMVFIEMWI